jgi:hypothetical protein
VGLLDPVACFVYCRIQYGSILDPFAVASLFLSIHDRELSELAAEFTDWKLSGVTGVVFPLC